jgi:AhpD family alkylhydroperoxidase
MERGDRPAARPASRSAPLDYTRGEARDGIRHRTTGASSHYRENAVTTIEATEWAECVLEPKPNPEVERFLRKNLGVSPPGMQGFAECPWIFKFFIGVNFRKAMLAHTSFELADLIGLVVSQDNSCRYCFAEQRILLRASGMSETQIRRLEQDLATAELNERELLALEFARRLSRSNPLPSSGDRKALVDAGFSEDAVKELSVVAAVLVAANRIVTLPALPPEAMERYPDRWRMKLLGPLVRRVMQSRWKRGRPESLAAGLKSGPFSTLILGFDGLPLARALREIVDEAWNSPILTPRTKALIVAVIARGIGAAESEAEARRLLAEEGMESAEIGEVLAHLTSPDLDRIEALCVPFARETIRYRPAQIQRRAKEVREQLSGPQFLELVGIAALANMLCRLETVADAA